MPARGRGPRFACLPAVLFVVFVCAHARNAFAAPLLRALFRAGAVSTHDVRPHGSHVVLHLLLTLPCPLLHVLLPAAAMGLSQ